MPGSINPQELFRLPSTICYSRKLETKKTWIQPHSHYWYRVKTSYCFFDSFMREIYPVCPFPQPMKNLITKSTALMYFQFVRITGFLQLILSIYFTGLNLMPTFHTVLLLSCRKIPDIFLSNPGVLLTKFLFNVLLYLCHSVHKLKLK